MDFAKSGRLFFDDRSSCFLDLPLDLHAELFAELPFLICPRGTSLGLSSELRAGFYPLDSPLGLHTSFPSGDLVRGLYWLNDNGFCGSLNLSTLAGFTPCISQSSRINWRFSRCAIPTCRLECNTLYIALLIL